MIKAELTKKELRKLTINELRALLNDKTISNKYRKKIIDIIKEKEIDDEEIQ